MYIGSRSADSLTGLKRLAKATGGVICTAGDSSEIREKIFNTYNEKIEDLTDSDGDRIPDLYEMMGVVLQNGEIALTQAGNPDTDGDGIWDGVELGITDAVNINMQLVRYRSSGEDAYKWKRCFSCVSNPALADSDGDGVEDGMDRSPLEKMDEHFRVIESYDACDYWDLLSDSYKETIDRVGKLYNTKKIPGFQQIGNYVWDYLTSLGGYTILSGMINNKVWTATPNAADLYRYYLAGSGTTYFLSEFPYAVALTRSQRYSYYNDLNSYMDMVERTVKPQNEYFFSTTTDNPWVTSYYQTSKNTAIEADWYLSIGWGQNALVSEVVCRENENGQKRYFAKVKFYLLDYYDWEDGTSESDLYELHLCGLAQSFVDYGIYETEIEWEEGARYPLYALNTLVDINQIKFDKISDCALEPAYMWGKAVYAP